MHYDMGTASAMAVTMGGSGGALEEERNVNGKAQGRGGGGRWREIKEETELGDAMLKDAKGVLLEMQQQKIRPDTATINSFIQALSASPPCSVRGMISSSSGEGVGGKARGGDVRDDDAGVVRDSLSVLQGMIEDQIVPDDVTYTILFTALGKAGMGEEALYLFRSAVGTSNMDEQAINALLLAFLSGPRPSFALALFSELTSRDLLKGQVEAFVPTKVTFTILYQALARHIVVKKGSPKDMEKTKRRLVVGGGGSRKALKEDLVLTELSLQQMNEAEDDGLDWGDVDSTVATASTTSKAAYSSTSSTMSGSGSGSKEELGDAKVSNSILSSPFLPSLFNAIQTSSPSSDSLSSPAFTSLNINAPFSSSSTTASPLLLKPSALLNQKLENLEIDSLLKTLFRQMRYTYNIEPDDKMVSALNSLFSTANMYLKPGSSAPIWGGGGSGGGIEKGTAETIFEELVIAGWEPIELFPIFNICSYSAKQRQDLLAAPSTTTTSSSSTSSSSTSSASASNLAVQQLRAAAASKRIFRKYEWNEISSGWAAIF